MAAKKQVSIKLENAEGKVVEYKAGKIMARTTRDAMKMYSEMEQVDKDGKTVRSEMEQVDKDGISDSTGLPSLSTCSISMKMYSEMEQVDKDGNPVLSEIEQLDMMIDLVADSIFKRVEEV